MKIAIILSVFSFLISMSTFAFFPTTDSLPTNFTAINIAQHGRIDLSNFESEFRKRGIEKIFVKSETGKIYSRYPVLLGIMSAPIFIGVNTLFGIHTISDIDLLNSRYVQTVGKINAAFYIGLSVALLYLILQRFFPPSLSVAFTGIFYLASPIFNTAAQGNWQHAMSVFFVLLGLLIYIHKPLSLKHLWIASFIWGFAASLRMSNGLYVVFPIIYLLSIHRCTWRHIALIMSAVFLGMSPHIITSVIHHIPSGYMYDLARTQEVFSFKLIALNAVSLFLSPNYGLLIYSPVFFTSFIGAWVGRRAPYIIAASATIVCFTLLAATWWVWTGGAALDARMLTEAMPLFILTSGYGLQKLWKLRTVPQLILRPLIIAAILWGVFTHMLTVYALDLSWNDKYLIYGYKNQLRNAWYTQPTLLEYTWNMRDFRLVYMFRSGNEIKTRTINYTISLKHGIVKRSDATIAEFTIE